MPRSSIYANAVVEENRTEQNGHLGMRDIYLKEQKVLPCGWNHWCLKFAILGKKGNDQIYHIGTLKRKQPALERHRNFGVCQWREQKKLRAPRQPAPVAPCFARSFRTHHGKPIQLCQKAS